MHRPVRYEHSHQTARNEQFDALRWIFAETHLCCAGNHEEDSARRTVKDRYTCTLGGLAWTMPRVCGALGWAATSSASRRPCLATPQ
jgi:hypothetical protein